MPRKNILEFKGKPLLGWTIECAQRTGLFPNVWVSTEDQEIGEIAEAFGATWLKRPEELGTDTATVAQVCVDFLSKFDPLPDVLVCLYPAVPFREPDDIQQTLQLIEEGADSAMTITNYWYDPCEALRVLDGNKVELMWPDLAETRRQERPQLAIDAGSVYCVRVESFMKKPDFYGGDLRSHRIPRLRAVDLDDPEDWELLQLFN